MSPTWCWSGVLALFLHGIPAQAQVVRAAVYGVAATNSEVARIRQARGLGLAADLGIELGRWRLEMRGITASLPADRSVQPDYAMQMIEATATYRWLPPLAFQAGVARRFFSPDFAAQEVGLVSVGVLSESRLSSVGLIRGHAAYLPITRFSGGGDTGLAVELGLGVAIGRVNGRFAGLLDYTYQRIDRRVGGEPAPISWSVVRAGLGARL